jgi:hypothetical protein
MCWPLRAEGAPLPATGREGPAVILQDKCAAEIPVIAPATGSFPCAFSLSQVQNADDAGASCVKFCLDLTQHGTASTLVGGCPAPCGGLGHS